MLFATIYIKLVQVVIKQRSKVLREIITLLQTGAKAICQGSDVRNVLVLADFIFFFDMGLKARVILVE